MIDFDATLQQFFAEIVKYLNNLGARARDKVELAQIKNAISEVEQVAANPIKYADYGARVQAGLERLDMAAAFMPRGSNDNRVFLLYQRVVNNIEKLDSQFAVEREQGQKVLLDALKAIKYRNSASLFKGLYFPFVSAEKFASKVQKQR